MRKIENAVTVAIENKNGISLGNTVINIHDNVLALSLYGNQILKADDANVTINMHGYNTATTRSRLNAALMGINSSFKVKCKNGIAKLLKNGELICDIPSSGEFTFAIK